MVKAVIFFHLFSMILVYIYTLITGNTFFMSKSVLFMSKCVLILGKSTLLGSIFVSYTEIKAFKTSC